MGVRGNPTNPHTVCYALPYSTLLMLPYPYPYPDAVRGDVVRGDVVREEVVPLDLWHPYLAQVRIKIIIPLCNPLMLPGSAKVSMIPPLVVGGLLDLSKDTGRVLSSVA